MARVKTRSEQAPVADDLPEAGELLAVEAIDRTGLAITTEGAFVRIIGVTPPNPVIMSDEERRATSAAFCHLVGRLRPDQAVQFYVEARPVDLDNILLECRREVAAWAGEPPSAGEQKAPIDLSRWRLYAAMEESLRQHSDVQAAMHFNAYVVVPYVPSGNGARELLRQLSRGRKLPSSSLERELRAHRRAVRESLAHTDAIRSELDALNLPTRLLNGEEVASLLWSRFNPTQADRGRKPVLSTTEVLGELDAAVEADEARLAAVKLRGAIARSPLDFEESTDHVVVDRDVEQTIYAAGTADATYMGWLMSAMMTRQPYSLSVFVHGLDRSRERSRVKAAYRRTFAMNRGAEAKGRVPDFDRYAQEQERERLLAEMAGHDRANLFEVSIYQSLRASNGDVASLAEAVDYCTEQIESSADCKVNKGKWQQRDLWETSLPLGRDVAERTRKYATRNVGDIVPLVGTSCGSPNGIPFAFSDPGRELQLWNPWDRAHANGMVTVTGQSGSGKTNTLNMLLGRALSFGARGFVLDRAGHFSTLVALVDGAREVELGADASDWAINPWDVADLGSVSIEKVSFLVSLHSVMMGDEGLTTLERAQLGAAIRGVYHRALAMEEVPRESMLRDELIARSEAERTNGAQEIAAALRNLAERLGEFCGDGAYAYLLDRETNVPVDSPLVVFDTRRVPDVVLRPVMYATLEFVTRTVESHRDACAEISAQPDAPLAAGKSIVVIDEGWALVGNNETGSYANDLARRSRHLGIALVVASQQLSDFDTEYGVALLRNATQHLLLSQNADEVRFAVAALRLSDQEGTVIGRLKTVKGSHAQAFWINGTRGRGQIAVRLGNTEQWAFSSDPVRDAPKRNAMVAQFGGNTWAAIHELAQHGAPQTQAA